VPSAAGGAPRAGRAMGKLRRLPGGVGSELGQRFASPPSLFGGLGNPQTRTASPKPAIAGLPDLMALLASQVQSL